MDGVHDVSGPGPPPLHVAGAAGAGDVAIATLGPDDVADAVEVLAEAFRDNPLNRAVIRSRRARRRQRANAAGLRGQLPVAIAHGRALGARRDGRLLGALLATPPFGRPWPLPPLRARLATLVRQGPGVARRWSEAHDLLIAHEPVVPHWYLALLGVGIAFQGRGVGARLLAAFLAEVDGAHGRVFLETDREENVGFYARAGFRTVGELRVFSVPVWLLERAPRKGGA